VILLFSGLFVFVQEYLNKDEAKEKIDSEYSDLEEMK